MNDRALWRSKITTEGLDSIVEAIQEDPQSVDPFSTWSWLTANVMQLLTGAKALQNTPEISVRKLFYLAKKKIKNRPSTTRRTLSNDNDNHYDAF